MRRYFRSTVNKDCLSPGQYPLPFRSIIAIFSVDCQCCQGTYVGKESMSTSETSFDTSKAEFVMVGCIQSINLSEARWSPNRNYFISPRINDRDEILTAIPMFSGSSSSKESRSTLADIDRYRKYKMAAAISDIVICPVLDWIEARFQRLHLHLRGHPIQRTSPLHLASK